MIRKTLLASLLLATFAGAAPASSQAAAPAAVRNAPSDVAVKTAKHAVTTYRKDIVDTLAKLVSFNTVADKDVPSDKNPVHIAFKEALKAEAARLGLDYADHGWTVIIGLGQGSERVGTSPTATCSLSMPASGRSRPSCWTAPANPASCWRAAPRTTRARSPPRCTR